MGVPGNKSFMDKVAAFVVDKRRIILIAIILACGVCAYTSTLVKTVDSLEPFLPADTDTRLGMDIMDNEFITYDTAQIMVSNIDYDRALELSEQIEQVAGVKEVEFDDTNEHFEGVSALFDVTFNGADDAQESRDSLAAVEDLLSPYDTYINTEVGNPLKTIIDQEMVIVDIIAFGIIFVVLLFTSRTYGEIPVLMLTFGAAALLNMGTNFLMGELCFVTDSIALVLQVALALDYAIILCHRFSEERRDKAPREAAIVATKKAVPEVAGSSLTTISGLLALTFMQYRLGADLGWVLIKAIFFSMFSVFVLMPGLLVMFSGWIDKTPHKSFLPEVHFLGKFGYSARKFIPPAFVGILIFACIISGQADYVYDQYSVEAIRHNEVQLAKKKIQDTFLTPVQFAVIIPAGDSESEKLIVEQIKEMDDTVHVTGLSDIEAMDGYNLLDEVTPRQFSEIMEIDIEIAQVIFGSYAVENEEYGHVLTSVDTYTVPLLDIFDYLLERKDDVTLDLDQETLDDIDEMQEKLDEGKLQLLSDNWSRIVVDADFEAESDEAYQYLSALHGIGARYYDTCYVVGLTATSKDLKTSFETDNKLISLLSITFVLLVLIFTFKSVGLPILLILVIQGSIWLNFTSPYLTGNKLFFLTYLIISAIQMGSNIDYAIVISGRYQEFREMLPPKEAMIRAMEAAFLTVITSGSMLTLAGVCIGLVTSNETISAIGVYLSKGTFISMILVLFVLPSVMLLGEKLIARTSFTIQRSTPNLERSGLVRLDGRVKGTLNGYIDGEVHGYFRGDISASVEVGKASSASVPPPAFPEASPTQPIPPQSVVYPGAIPPQGAPRTAPAPARSNPVQQPAPGPDAGRQGTPQHPSQPTQASSQPIVRREGDNQ